MELKVKEMIKTLEDISRTLQDYDYIIDDDEVYRIDEIIEELPDMRSMDFVDIRDKITDYLQFDFSMDVDLSEEIADRIIEIIKKESEE